MGREQEPSPMFFSSPEPPSSNSGSPFELILDMARSHLKFLIDRIQFLEEERNQLLERIDASDVARSEIIEELGELKGRYKELEVQFRWLQDKEIKGKTQ